MIIISLWGEEAAVTSNGHTVACPGKRRGGGSHSQWAGTRERGDVAAVIHSGRAHGRGVVAVVIRSAWARGERRGREEGERGARHDC